MPTTWHWHAPVAITASRWLQQELRQCEQHAGCEFAYTTNIPDGRRHGRRALVIIGFDLIARVRAPIRSRSHVIVATLDRADVAMFQHAHRIGAPYVIALPAARPWLVEQLLHPPVS